MIRFDGADISHHQDDAGPIDWPLLRAVSWWVATKATQSTKYVDPTCDPHRAQMSAQDFVHRGFYHWLSHTTDPAAQAAHFLKCVGTLHVGEFAMLDAEEGGITVAMVLDWLAAVEAVTHRPCSVYTGAYVAGGTIWQSTMVRNSPYGPRPMHLAAYTTEAKALKLPGVAAYPWSAWQYSSNGPVPGVTGRCDMNRIDIPAHYDLAAGIVTPPLPPPTPQPPQPPQELDMPQVITNDEPASFQGVTYPKGAIKWVIDRPNVEENVASKRHLEGAEHAAYGSPAGTFLNNAQLNDLPDFVPDVAGDGDGVDREAREMASMAHTEALHANEAVTRIGSTISDIRMGGQRIADAGGH